MDAMRLEHLYDGLVGNLTMTPEPSVSVCADGFEMLWTFEAETTYPEYMGPFFGLDALRMELKFGGLLVGRGECGERRLKPSRSGTMRALVRVPISSRSIARLEEERKGGAATFEAYVEVEVVKYVPSAKPNGTWRPIAIPLESNYCRDSMRWTIPKEQWIDILEKVGYRHSFVVEMVMPRDAPTGWESVWNLVRRAEANLHSGLYSEGGLAIRQALEAWDKIEAGLDVTAVKSSEREKWTVEQRLSGIRYAIKLYTHAFVHDTTPARWTRQQLLLALTTVSSLLNLRWGG